MNNSTHDLLKVYDLRKNYEMPSDVLQVLKGVGFSMKAGEVTFIVGRSGSGKSTLLHLIGGLDQPTSGKILFEGEDIVTMKEKTLTKIRNRRLGYVFQFYHLLPELTVYENVILPSMIAGRCEKKWVREILRRVKLLSRQNHYPSELSGGEQQRVAIARALVNQPALVLCDEPTGNLDVETSEEVFSLIGDLNREHHQSFLIITHDEAVAWRYERVYRLVDGILLKVDRNQEHARSTV
ncbi:MAG: ABC transporter ATP-binding protein [Candidatus Omnitrophica bacterium]|nr:ABC transporter ATP-binding protein [Candidatus Omnitrophota bacterium]